MELTSLSTEEKNNYSNSFEQTKKIDIFLKNDQASSSREEEIMERYVPIVQRRVSSCASCCDCCPKVSTERQYINLGSGGYNYTKFSNIVKNQKYNVITLIPIVLLNQFSLFSNQFYLLMALSQFINELKVGFLFSYVAPLVFVLTITIIKEAYDDYYRYKQDKEANNQSFMKVSGGNKMRITSKEIQVGDIIELNVNERVPADMILLKSFDESGSVFIRTDQLDGETDWKLRKAPPYSQRLKEYLDFTTLSGHIEADPPSRDIYDFNGVLHINHQNSRLIKDSLSLENTLWANTVIASKRCLGVVIYTGKETRSQMNSSTPKVKVGLLDLEINTLNKVLFTIMLLSALLILIVKGFSNVIIVNLITFFRFVVLLCSIIPISLRVNLDISKALNSSKINSDTTYIPETIVRNSQVPEDLGRIEYVFSDKTGTLTKNEMVFKKLSLETDQFSEDNFSDLSMLLEDECKSGNAPLLDVLAMREKGQISDMSKRIRRNRSKVVRDAVTAMTICNNVTPVVPEDLSESLDDSIQIDQEKVEYQASSPDEISLVKFTARLKMCLKSRTDKEVIIKNTNNEEEKYEVLALFPFTSESKRMGIIVKSVTHGHIIFYLKGAENIIEKVVKEEYKSYILENAETLACSGLRTLVLSQKLLDAEFYENWKRLYEKALTSMDDRKDKVRRAIELLENDMEFLGVTGVEDHLQDEVAETIESLKNAGMRVWMLTGDKIETAMCISISAGLKSKIQKFFVIKEDNSIENVYEQLNKYGFNSEENILIIDGQCLDTALKNHEKLFFDVTLKAPAVVCCRCSPTQKSLIVRTLKKYTNKRSCSIGDGGNDVAMIQEANIGIGIVGKEGRQASLAADYSITKFKHLSMLLLWYGRLSYKNTATVSKFVIHRGLIISFIQFIFSIIFYCTPIPIYNGMLILGYSSVFTNFPVLSLLLDRDTEMKNVLKFPPLYKVLQKGRELSTQSFLLWFMKSLYQASIIMFGAVLIFDTIFLKIVTITFSALIFAELLNVYTEIQNIHKLMILSLFGTLTCYLLSFFFLKSVLDFYFAIEIITFAKIVILSLVSWLPFFIYAKLKSGCFPEAHEKLNLIEN